MFTDYLNDEIKLFNAVRGHFEKLPPLDSDDYENAFFDVVAQYGPGSEEFIVVGALYNDLIEETILKNYNILSETDKLNVKLFYESHFLENYYSIENDEYSYTSEDLAARITDRFKMWIEDSFSIEDLLSDEDDDEEVDQDADDLKDDENEDGDNEIESLNEMILEKKLAENGYDDIERHPFQITFEYYSFFNNFKTNLKIIEAYFKYLNYVKTSDLTYSLTYYGQDSTDYHNIDEILLDIDKCITYQLSNNDEIEISCDLNFKQTIMKDDTEINLFYHGQLWLHNIDYAAVIYWNSHWNTPSFEMRLENAMSPETQLALFENFHIVIADIIEIALR